VKIEIKDVTRDNFNDIPNPSSRVNCKSCDYWEGGLSVPGSDALVKEENKKSRIRLELVHAKMLSVDGKVVGYSQYGTLSSFPHCLAWRRQFKTPVSEDTFIVTCVSIQREFRGRGLASLLLASIVNELKSKGVKAIEACVQRPYSEKFSMGPERLYMKCGFTLFEELPHLSLMRLVLRIISCLPVDKQY